MEYLFGFIFTLFKITFQAAVYATLLCRLVRLVDARHLSNTLVRATRIGRPFWWCSFVVAYGSLLLFFFTYWGNHGLGDSARIPIGHGEAVEEINGTEVYFKPLQLSAGDLTISRFQVSDEVLCGQASDESYFTYDLVSKKQRLFADSQEYTDYARQHSLPVAEELEPFRTHYVYYWSWRLLLLA